MSDERQAKHERRIFRHFVKNAKLELRPDTVRSRRPPEPDIRCRTLAGESVAFELVEIVDENIIRGMSEQFELQRALERAWADRPMAETGSRYRNAMPAVTFVPSARKVSRLAAVPAIVDLLIAQDPEPSGEVDFERIGKLKPVAHLVVHRGEFSGPCFDVSNGGSFSDPLWDRVKGKLQRSYATADPIELLAFYELQSPRPKSIGLPPMPHDVGAILEDSAIRRVWVYDANRGEILLRRDRSDQS
jgi:hypothetical protein